MCSYGNVQGTEYVQPMEAGDMATWVIGSVGMSMKSMQMEVQARTRNERIIPNQRYPSICIHPIPSQRTPASKRCLYSWCIGAVSFSRTFVSWYYIESIERKKERDEEPAAVVDAKRKNENNNDDANIFGSCGCARNVRHDACHSNIASTTRQKLPREPNGT